jgi:hypothetical protein
MWIAIDGREFRGSSAMEVLRDGTSPRSGSVFFMRIAAQGMSGFMQNADLWGFYPLIGLALF